MLFLSINPQIHGLNDKLNITVSIEPIAFIVEEVGGPYVNVISLVPEGVEFHQVVVTPDMMEVAINSDIIIITGHLRWEYKLLQTIQERKGVPKEDFAIDMLNDLSDKLTILYFPGTKELNLHGFWLFPNNTIAIAEMIANRLSILDPENSRYYKWAFKTFRDRIDKIISQAIEEFKELDIYNADVIVTTPPEQYIMEALGFNVDEVIIHGELQDITPSTVFMVRKKLLQGNYFAIIISDIGKMMAVYNYVKEISLETGVALLEIRTMTFGGVHQYESILIYNISRLSSPYFNSKIYINTNGEYWQIIAILLIVIIIQFIAVFKGVIR